MKNLNVFTKKTIKKSYTESTNSPIENLTTKNTSSSSKFNSLNTIKSPNFNKEIKSDLVLNNLEEIKRYNSILEKYRKAQPTTIGLDEYIEKYHNYGENFSNSEEEDKYSQDSDDSNDLSATLEYKVELNSNMTTFLNQGPQDNTSIQKNSRKYIKEDEEEDSSSEFNKIRRELNLKSFKKTKIDLMKYSNLHEVTEKQEDFINSNYSKV